MEGALRWFDATYELTATMGRAWYRRVCLPGPGSMADQDERLMTALELLEAVHNDLLTAIRPSHDDEC